MRKIKQLLSILMLTLILVNLTGCKMKAKGFDISGYIASVLNNTYKSDSNAYINFTGISEQEANLINNTTITNSTIRFFEKYQMNASEEQETELSLIFKDIYSKSTYSVSAETKTDSGYNVEINYTPTTTFIPLSSQIVDLKNAAGIDAYTSGAAYIDNVIALCKDASKKPLYGNSEVLNIDIKLNPNGDLLLNVKLFYLLDKELLPFD